MSAHKNIRDRRYRIAPEFCGYARRRHVARFCDEWLGQAATPIAARAIVKAHRTLRIAVLEGSVR